MFGLMTRNQNIYNPFRQMEALEQAFFGNAFATPTVTRFRTDVSDGGDHYLLEADLPGFDKKDIVLELQEDTLTIRAERYAKTEEEKDKVIRMERTYGAYQRSFDISGVDADKIQATYTDGVLRLTLPKLEPKLPQTRRLEIQ